MARSYCQSCGRPSKVCLCADISPQQNTKPVLVLQHRDECEKPLSTIPLISKGLLNSAVHSGLIFSRQQCTDTLRILGASNPVLLYPNELLSKKGHITVDFESERSHNQSLLRPFDSFIVLDGTWRNTRELVLANSWLASYPTIGLENAGESLYRIRQAKQAGSLSSIEALARVLSLSDCTFDTERLLRPFIRMVDMQIQYMGKDIYQRNYC